ncbi:MAG: PIN domain-containing protein [Spirochaetia bacterium]
MKIGIDSSVIIAGVHAAHPRHALAVDWLTRMLPAHELIVAHHSILEAYAVLTRLPGDNRVTPSEARDLLNVSVKENMTVAEYHSESIWTTIGSFVMTSVFGGRSYDAFVADILHAAAVDAIATFNPAHFRGLSNGTRIMDPSDPGERGLTG